MPADKGFLFFYTRGIQHKLIYVERRQCGGPPQPRPANLVAGGTIKLGGVTNNSTATS